MNLNTILSHLCANINGRKQALLVVNLPQLEVEFSVEFEFEFGLASIFLQLLVPLFSTDRKGKVMFSQVFVCPQSASWILVHCLAFLRRGRYASYWNAFLFSYAHFWRETQTSDCEKVAVSLRFEDWWLLENRRCCDICHRHYSPE